LIKAVNDLSGVVTVLTLENYNPELLYDKLVELLDGLDEFHHGLGITLTNYGMGPNITLLLGNPTNNDVKYVFNVYGYSDPDDRDDYLDELKSMMFNNMAYTCDVDLPIQKDSLEDPTIGTVFMIQGLASLGEDIVGLGSSYSDYLRVMKIQKSPLDEILVMGTVSIKALEITKRREGPVRQTNVGFIEAIEHSNPSTLSYITSTITYSELITYGHKKSILTNRESLSHMKNPLIDIGSAELTNIYMTENVYLMIDKVEVPTYNVPNVEFIKMEVPLNTDDVENPFTQLLDTIEESYDLICFNSLTFQPASKFTREELAGNMYEQCIKFPLLNNVKRYLQKYPNANLYFNFPYCDESLYYSTREFMNLDRYEIEDDDEDVFTRYTCQFGTHGEVVMLNYTEVEQMVDDLVTVLNGNPLRLVPSKLDIAQMLTQMNRSIPSIGMNNLYQILSLAPTYKK